MCHANSHILIEACIEHPDDALVAARSGADRLELNAALALDGLTPTPDLVKTARRATDLPLIAMVRPRAGGFVYSQAEAQCMVADIDAVRAAGAHGVALGALKEDGSVDSRLCAELARAAAGLTLVFHRALDHTADAARAIEELIDLGFARILTSGGAASAVDGAEHIRRLSDLARGRIEILPGGGVRAENVVQVVRRTGCRQVHGTFRRLRASENAGIRLDTDELTRVRSALTALG